MRELDQNFDVWRLKRPQGLGTINATVPFSNNNGQIASQWAMDGHGIILCSIWDVDARLKNGRLVRMLPKYLQDADVSAIYPLRLTEFHGGTGVRSVS